MRSLLALSALLLLALPGETDAKNHGAAGLFGRGVIRRAPVRVVAVPAPVVRIAPPVVLAPRAQKLPEGCPCACGCSLGLPCTCAAKPAK